MNEEFVLRKNIDWSVFYRGFAVPIEMQAVFSLHLSGGKLFHGEKRPIKIIFDGETHLTTLTSVNFDRKKYTEHSEMWQIVYGKNSSIAKAMRKIFAGSLKLLEKNRQDKNFIFPADEKEYFVLYATDFKDTFYLEPIFNNEILDFGSDEPTLENLFELPTLTDSEAEIVEKYRLTKVRKLNRSIGNYLKKLYNFRCQICGQNIGDIYGVEVIECHHIDYFVKFTFIKLFFSAEQIINRQFGLQKVFYYNHFILSKFIFSDHFDRYSSRFDVQDFCNVRIKNLFAIKPVQQIFKWTFAFIIGLSCS